MPIVDEYARTSGATTTATSSTGAAPTDQLEADVPNIETPAYARTLPRIRKCRDMFMGAEAIRAGGERYLPKFQGETAAGYLARSTIAAPFNGYARTILATVGIVTEPEPVLAKDMPDKLVAMWENADGAGTHGAILGKQLVTAAMLDGYAGIFTDMPRADDPRLDRSRASLAASLTPDNLDASDVEALGLRPYFIIMRVDEVLPVYETVNGKRTLVQFIYRQYQTRKKGRFGFTTVTRYRVFELQKDGTVTFEVWETDAPGGTPRRVEDPRPMRNLTRIPWSPLIAGEKLGEHEYKPTLLDLADLNITHHRIATGILSLEELACVPTPVRIGATPDADGNYPELIFGPSNTIEAPAVQGVAEPVYWLSPDTSVLAPAMESLETCKREMSTMGATFLAPDAPAQKTATESRIDAGGERATVFTVARAYQDCLESAFADAGAYLGLRAGSVTTNHDFTGAGIDPQLLAQVTAAYQSGGLSKPEYRTFIQTGQLPEDFDPNDLTAGMADLPRTDRTTTDPQTDPATDPNADPNRAAA